MDHDIRCIRLRECELEVFDREDRPPEVERYFHHLRIDDLPARNLQIMRRE